MVSGADQPQRRHPERARPVRVASAAACHTAIATIEEGVERARIGDVGELADREEGRGDRDDHAGDER